MPHMRFRGMKAEQVANLSQTLPQQLAPAMETSEDNFSFELINTQYFTKGQSGGEYPFVEVLWFQRSQEVQDKSAMIITEKVKALFPQDDIAVIFIPLEKKNYYENGSHF
ncbi:DUF1904 domain-containing protein [Bdellovibrio sp. HCB288]|uniref:DUF1904 domain-containing protein n=1 Tax=Bdellovibrio sp. HCB288 TaxID=3394355 RepID=UPI0039B54A74